MDSKVTGEALIICNCDYSQCEGYDTIISGSFDERSVINKLKENKFKINSLLDKPHDTILERITAFIEGINSAKNNKNFEAFNFECTSFSTIQVILKIEISLLLMELNFLSKI